MNKFLIKSFLFSSPVLLMVIFYFIYDPFDVLHKNSYSNVPNRDFVSTEAFIRNYSAYKYDSYIFGNSRSIFFEVIDWEKHITFKNCFHFDASGESLYGIEKKLSFLYGLNVEMRNVLLLVDYETLMETNNSKGHLFIKHPLISGESYYSFQKEFFSAFFDIYYLKSLVLSTFLSQKQVDNDNSDYNIKYNEIKYSKYERMIEKNPDDYYIPKTNIFYKRDSLQSYYPQIIGKKQKDILSNIASILNQKKTYYKIIINPLYDQKKIDTLDLKELKNIFGKSNVFDFSGINFITEDVHNYYETSHYRPHVSRMILNEVYKDQSN